MSRKAKKKHKQQLVLAPAVLRERVERAIAEGRFQQALDLAHTLHKQAPSDISKVLLQKASLGRARYLRNLGHTRDATVILENVLKLGGDPAILAEAVQELAASGAVVRALEFLPQITDPRLTVKVLTHAADSAVRQGPAGRNLLPEALRGQFDLIVKAFAESEAGQDEQVRETLQGIGLQSPFLEWKLLLRGLLAYYQKDDTRALENWQRLDSERLPARLAAPFRFLIDKGFQAAQPPATQTALQQQADQLQGPGIAKALRALQTSLGNERQLSQAFRQAEGVVQALRREAPEMVSRLAACFYWAVVHHGMPEDMSRYQRVFGPPADDPRLARLEALALEQRGQMQEAHKFWQEFEKSLANNPAWPADQAQRARALVWRHMGANADSVPDLSEVEDLLPPFLRDHADRPRPLKPSAEECYQKSLALAPDQLETYQALCRHFLEAKKPAKAETAARTLLEHFPEHAETLEALARLRLHAQDYAEAVSLYERALKANPLERRLRGSLATAHSFLGRSLAEEGKFDEARQAYQAALTIDAGQEDYPILCKWAACEFKAGDEARAEELLQKAHQEKGSRLPVAFHMLIEAIRFKLRRPLKTRFDKEVNELLAEPPNAAAAVSLVDTVAVHRQAGVTYLGQKTHEKKVLTYLEKAKGLPFTEPQLESLCANLKELEAAKVRLQFIKLGQEQYPANPYFLVAEAEQEVTQKTYRARTWVVQDLLKQARELATAMPRSDRQHQLLEEIQRLEHELHILNPFAGLMESGGMMDFFGMDDEDDYDEDDEEDGYDGW